jgi:NADPH:quinone reductase-like Zn-dependent oxidoreductase
MHAIRIDAFGSAPRLADLPDPVPGPGEVAIDLRAAGVGIWDAMIRDGTFPVETSVPLTLGFEGTGVVSALGADVATLAVGERVMFYAFALPNGAYAEKIVVDATAVAPIPKTLDFVQAAALPVAGITAWLAVVEQTRVVDRNTILITAAAGGVGMIAVQLARTHGAVVIATGSAANEAFVRGLGASDYIDYTANDVVETVRKRVPGGVDVVLEGAAKGNGPRNVAALRTGGTFVDLVGMDVTSDDPTMRLVHIQAEPGRKRLETLAGYVDAGALRVQIDRTFPLAQAADALAYVEQGHTRGKVVLTID